MLLSTDWQVSLLSLVTANLRPWWVFPRVSLSTLTPVLRMVMRISHMRQRVSSTDCWKWNQSKFEGTTSKIYGILAIYTFEGRVGSWSMQRRPLEIQIIKLASYKPLLSFISQLTLIQWDSDSHFVCPSVKVSTQYILLVKIYNYCRLWVTVHIFLSNSQGAQWCTSMSFSRLDGNIGISTPRYCPPEGLQGQEEVVGTCQINHSCSPYIHVLLLSTASTDSGKSLTLAEQDVVV